MTLIQNLYKPLGVTPLEILNKYLEKNGKSDQKATYVGRLDPMAHGVQLILIEPSRIEVEKLKSLNKTYVSEVLFGIQTDTYDLMGKPVLSEKEVKISKDQLLDALQAFTGEINQKYPPYSAAKVQGKPLHFWAKEGLIDTISIPTHIVSIDEIKLINSEVVSFDTILDKCLKYIPKVTGDFRQQEIIEGWSKSSEKTQSRSFQKATIEISCSSGTYIRQLVHELGEKLGTSAFCFDIYRTKVGTYSIDTSVKL